MTGAGQIGNEGSNAQYNFGICGGRGHLGMWLRLNLITYGAGTLVHRVFIYEANILARRMLRGPMITIFCQIK